VEEGRLEANCGPGLDERSALIPVGVGARIPVEVGALDERSALIPLGVGAARIPVGVWAGLMLRLEEASAETSLSNSR